MSETWTVTSTTVPVDPRANQATFDDALDDGVRGDVENTPRKTPTREPISDVDPLCGQQTEATEPRR